MKLKKYLPVIGILLFGYIIFKLDFSNILKEIANAKVEYLFIAISFVFIHLITGTLKWFSIAKIQKINLPFFEALKINLISFFYGFITPSRIGGIIRAEYLKKYTKKGIGKGVSNFVLDKVLDLCSLVFLATIFSFVFRDLISGSYFYYFIFIFIAFVISLIIFRDKKRTIFLLRIFYRKFIPEKIKEKVKNGFNSFYEDMPKKRYFILFFLLNLINWIIYYLVSFFVGKSVGIEISFTYFLVILPITTLIGQLPITINGLGTREAVMIVLFGLLGIGATKVFSMSIIILFISGVLPTIIGIFLILKNRRKI